MCVCVCVLGELQKKRGSDEKLFDTLASLAERTGACFLYRSIMFNCTCISSIQVRNALISATGKLAEDGDV